MTIAVKQKSATALQCVLMALTEKEEAKSEDQLLAWAAQYAKGFKGGGVPSAQTLVRAWNLIKDFATTREP